jgi:RecA-family ATPase
MPGDIIKSEKNNDNLIKRAITLCGCEPISLEAILNTTLLPRDMIWPGFPVRSTASLVAPGGTGKSMFALEIALSVAGGFETDKRLLDLGIQTPGKVAYLAFDDDWEDIFSRIQHLYQIDQQLLKENFTLFCLEGLDTPFNILNSSFGECLSENEQLCTLFKGYRLIIIDTLTQIHQQNENENSDMARVMSAFAKIKKRTGAAILFLHHVNKSAISNKTEDQTAGRGAITLVNGVRFSMNLTLIPDNKIGQLAELDEKGNPTIVITEKSSWLYIKATIAKQNIGKKEKPRWFKRDAETGIFRPVSIGSYKSKDKQGVSGGRIKQL